jgi:hypothetical protein
MRDIKINAQKNFWLDGIKKVLKANSEFDFMSKFLSFLNNLDFENISSAEQDLIKSEVFMNHNVTKGAREFVLDWLNSRTSKPSTPEKISQRASEMRKKVI